MYGPNMGCCCLTSHAQKKGSKKACVGNQRKLNMRGVWVPEYTLAVRKSFGGRGGLGLGIAIRVYATRLHALQRCHRLLGVPAASAAASIGHEHSEKRCRQGGPTLLELPEQLGQ